MATKKKHNCCIIPQIDGCMCECHGVKRGRAFPDWKCATPDDRNRLIEEARELIAAAQVTFKKVGVKTKDCPTWFKAANAFMKETKP